MKKTLLSLSILLTLNIITTLPSFAESEIISPQIKDQQAKKNLIDDWTDYRLIQYSFEQEAQNGAQELEKLLVTSQSDAEMKILNEKMSELTINSRDQLILKLNSLTPRTDKMRQLIDLQIQNITGSTDLLLNNILDAPDSKKVENNAAIKKAIEITRQTIELEKEIEMNTLRYLKDLRAQE